MSTFGEFGAPRQSIFGEARKKRQSIGAYTSLFPRKLLPPLGFYREADKYNDMKKKFDEHPEKLDALHEMWQDYKKYQIRKRFRWPPNLYFKAFFWTTGYYADYQKKSRATKLRKPGEDSSDEEFMGPLGQFQVAGAADGDINLDEFERYREAKKAGAGIPRYSIAPEGYGGGYGPHGSMLTEGGAPYNMDRRPTINRLFGDDNDNDHAHKSRRKSRAPKEVEEVETLVEVEYKLVKDPNKKKRKKSRRGDEAASTSGGSGAKGHAQIPGLSDEDAAALAEALGSTDPNKKVISRRRSVARTKVDETGQRTIDVEETDEPIVGERTTKRKSMMVAEGDEFIPARHSLTTLSTIWETTDENLKGQYSTHTLTVSNLPDKISIKRMAQLFPGTKVNVKTPKRPGERPYATVKFKSSNECRKKFLASQNLTIDDQKVIVNPKVKSYK